jgi:hypothetical protein
VRLLVIAALLLAAPTLAHAEDDPPDGRLAFMMGLQTGTGSLGRDFGVGHLLGVEAAWQPMNDEQWIGWGLHTSALFGGFEWLGLAEDTAAVSGSLQTVHMQLGLRARLPMRNRATVSFLSLGASILRSNDPLPPEPARAYIGGYVGLGAQLDAAGMALSVEVRRDMIFDGPGLMVFMLGIGFGV